MTERKVSAAADDDNIIEHVGYLNTHSISEPIKDEFAAPAEEFKKFDGTNAVFKRRVTNELKKFQRGKDGTESKQVHEKEFLTGYDAFDLIEPPYNLEYLAKLYEASAPHYAAVNAKVANIVGLGYRLVENTKTKRNLERMADDKEKVKKTRRKLDEHRDDVIESLEGMNEEDTLTETMIKVWRDYETTGNGYLEIGRKKDGTIGYLGHIPAQTLRIRRRRDGFVQTSGFKAQFFAQFGEGIDENGRPKTINNPVGDDRPNEVIHFKKYSPTSGYYGIPDIVAAMGAVAGNHAAEKYNLDYFENKAVPRYAVILKGAKLGAAAEESLLSFFETGLKGQNHRSIYIPLPGDTADNKVELKLEAIENGVQDASFVNYRRGNHSDICMAHRVPITKISVSENASLAIARDADKTFKEQVCGPEQRVGQHKFNRVVKELTDALDFVLNEMSLTDENTQSQIDERRRKTGVETANEQRIRRGDTATEGGDELFDMNAKAKQATAGSPGRERDAQRSANATDSAGEARAPKGDGRTTA